MSNTVNNTVKAKRPRGFKPGQSGNPNGRPKGARNRRTVLVEKILAGDAEAIARAVSRAALLGDMQAAKIVLDRIAPARKGAPVQFTPPADMTAADISTSFLAVLNATASGQLTPDEAAVVATLLEGARRVIETQDLEERLALVEGALGQTRRVA